MERFTDKHSNEQDSPEQQATGNLPNRAPRQRDFARLHDMSHIKGWAVDANPENDPTYPMRDRSREDSYGYDWDRPAQQPIDMEVLHSVERPGVSAVFGTSVPISGVSGWLRRLAFRYSEGTFTHWLTLLFADQVNMVEGVVEDLSRGQVPNLIAETGLKAQWQHDRKAVVTKVAIGVGLVAAAALVLTHNKNRRR